MLIKLYRWMTVCKAVCMILLLAFKSWAGPAIPVAKAPAWVQPFPLRELPDRKEEEVSDGYLFILRDYQVNVQEQTTYYHYAKKIYTDAGVQNGSEIEFDYDPSYEKLIFHTVHIVRNGNHINQLDPGKFRVIQREKSKESFVYDGSLSALLVLEDVRKGDLIEYTFSCVGRNPIYQGKYFGSFHLQGYDPIDQMLIRVIAPETRRLNIRLINTALAPHITYANGNAIYEWNQTRVAGLTPDTELPSWYEPYPYVWVGEFSNWSEVKDWAITLYQTPPQASSSLSAKIAEIQSENPTHEKRLEAALKFVQDEIRYTGLESGIGGYKPQQPSKVFSQRFGDCKGKALLFCYMLKQMGIEAYPALVNTDHRQAIKSWLPTPYAFNHCIAQVTINNKIHWYDPTLAHQRGDYQTIYCPNYRTALLIAPQASKLVDIPLSQLAKTQVNESFSVPGIQETVTYSIETVYSGYEADAQRAYSLGSNVKEMEKSYLNFYAKYYPKIRVEKPLKLIDDPANNLFTTYETYAIDDFFYAPDTLFPKNLECQLYPATLRDKIVIPSRPIRTMPIGLNFPSQYEHLTRVCLPEAWSIKSEKKIWKHPETEFSKTISYQDDTLTMKYTYQTLVDHVPGTRSKAYVKEQNKIIDELGYSLSYNQEAEAKPEFRINGIMVLLAGMFLLITSYVGYRLYQYDPQPKQVLGRSEEIGGWLILVAIALVFSPLRMLVIIFNKDYFNLAVWEAITFPSSTAYNPGLTALLVGEMFYDIFSLIYCLVLAVLFFKRRSSFPRLIIIFYACNVLFLALDAIMLQKVGTQAKPNWESLVKTIVVAIVWMPYFTVSKRVKRTFTSTLKRDENVMEVYQFRK